MTSSGNFKSLWQTALKFGIIYTMAIIVIDLMFFITGSYRGEHPVIDFIVSFISSVAIIFIGMKTRRDIDFNGYSKYGEVLKTALAIGVTASVLVALWKLAYYSFINPEELAKEYELIKKTILENDFFDEDKKMEILSQMKVANTAMSKLSSYLIMTNLYALIVGLILAIFLQKQHPDDAYNKLDV